MSDVGLKESSARIGQCLPEESARDREATTHLEENPAEAASAHLGTECVNDADVEPQGVGISSGQQTKPGRCAGANYP